MTRNNWPTSIAVVAVAEPSSTRGGSSPLPLISMVSLPNLPHTCLQTGSFSGNPSSDFHLVLPSYQSRVLHVNLCGPGTTFDTSVTLWTSCPSRSGAVLLANQDPDFFCSVLQYEANDIGTFWVC